MNITVLGDGGWGTATSCLLSKNKHNVILWGPFKENIESIKKNNINSNFLPGIKIPKEIILTHDLKTATSNADIIVLALPTQFMRKLLWDLKPLLFTNRQKIVNLAKGIENESLKRISEIIMEILGKNTDYSILSGPSHAEEVAKGIPTAIVAASKNTKYAEQIQDIFMSDTFRVYCSNDVAGVELGGSLKNVYAIAAGVADGMKLGDNSKAALITRSIAELSRLGKKLGGDIHTFSGLSGIGDLIVTCCSKHSRNRFVGEKLGEGKSLSEITKSMGMMIAEGVKTAKSAFELSKRKNVETPIIDEIYNVIYLDKNPKECISDLMTRTPKHEVY